MIINTTKASVDDDYSGLRRFLSSEGGKRDAPPDVEPGSDADIDRDVDEDDGLGESETSSEAEEPSPVDVGNDPASFEDGETTMLPPTSKVAA